MNTYGMIFVHFLYFLNRRQPLEQAKQEDSTSAEVQNRKKLQMTPPEENVLLSSEKENVFTTD
jgi:hypothetical protein